MDAREKDSGRWSDMWYLLLTFPELLVGGGLLVPCFLPGPPVIKQLMQMVTMVPGQVTGVDGGCHVTGLLISCSHDFVN